MHKNINNSKNKNNFSKNNDKFVLLSSPFLVFSSMASLKKEK